MIDKNYSQLILRGIEEGDQIGGPYELAKILLGSLKQKNGFNENDLRNKLGDAESEINRLNAKMRKRVLLSKIGP